MFENKTYSKPTAINAEMLMGLIRSNVINLTVLPLEIVKKLICHN